MLAARAPRIFLPRILFERDLLLQVGRVHLVVPVRVVTRAAQHVRAGPRHHRDGEPGAVPWEASKVDVSMRISSIWSEFGELAMRRPKPLFAAPSIV